MSQASITVFRVLMLRHAQGNWSSAFMKVKCFEHFSRQGSCPALHKWDWQEVEFLGSARKSYTFSDSWAVYFWTSLGQSPLLAVQPCGSLYAVVACKLCWLAAIGWLGPLSAGPFPVWVTGLGKAGKNQPVFKYVQPPVKETASQPSELPWNFGMVFMARGWHPHQLHQYHSFWK